MGENDSEQHGIRQYQMCIYLFEPRVIDLSMILVMRSQLPVLSSTDSRIVVRSGFASRSIGTRARIG